MGTGVKTNWAERPYEEQKMKKNVFAGAVLVAMLSLSINAFAGGVIGAGGAGIAHTTVTDMGLVASGRADSDTMDPTVGQIEDRRTEKVALSATVGGEELAGVKCTVSNDKGTWSLVTPGSVNVTRSAHDLSVSCEKDGYVTVAGVLDSKPTAIATKHFDWVSTEDARAVVPAYNPLVTVSMKSATVASN
jgi:hypothetical protein